MDLDLNGEQRERLELISMHIGKTPAQVLVDTALYLLDRDVQFLEALRSQASRGGCQTFLNDRELEARFSRMLGR